MSGRRNESLVLDDIVRAATRLVDVIGSQPGGCLGMDPDVDELVLWNLTVLGEASKRLSTETCDRFPHIPWAHFARTRDFLIHHYEGIDWQVIMEICTTDLPALLPPLVRARDVLRLESDSE